MHVWLVHLPEQLHCLVNPPRLTKPLNQRGVRDHVLGEPSQGHFVEQVAGNVDLVGAAIPDDEGVERVGVGAPAGADHEAEVPQGAGEVGAAAEGADDGVVGGGCRRRRGVAVHVGEEAEGERREGEAGEVGEEGGEGAVEERAERRGREGVEAEDDRERDGEEVAGRRGHPGRRGGEADGERDGERLRQGRREQGREAGQGRVEEPVGRGEDGGEVGEERRRVGGARQGWRRAHGRRSWVRASRGTRRRRWRRPHVGNRRRAHCAAAIAGGSRLCSFARSRVDGLTLPLLRDLRKEHHQRKRFSDSNFGSNYFLPRFI